MTLASSQTASPRILTIDDEDAVRRSIRAFLEDSDFEVFEAHDGREGLEVFRREKPDLVLCDLRMPDVDGLEVLATIHAEEPDMPVIIVSGTGVIGDAIEAVRLGAWDYLLKPIQDMGALELAIHKALERARLKQENRRYLEQLEEEVEKRTALIQQRSHELDLANQALIADIAEREWGERALRENEQYLRTIFNSLSVGMFIVDAETRQIVESNQAAQMMIGLPKDELRGSICHKHICPAEQGRCPVLDLGKAVDNSERMLLRADGSRLDVLKTVVPVTLGGRKCLLESVVDLTERRKTERALRESESRFRGVAEYLREGLVITDERDVVTYVNSRMAEMCGSTPEELVGCPTTVMVTEHGRGTVERKIDDRLNGISETYEIELLRKDGTAFWAEISAGPWLSADGQIIGSLSVVRDITDRKHAAAEREKLETHLRRSQKMETIGTLAGGVAHDFNNILTPILGYGEMAMFHIAKQSPARNDLEQIIQAAHRARDLVRQILTFSRQGDQERKPVLIQLIIKEALKLTRASLPTTIEIQEEIDVKCDPVLCEPTQLHQVLMNLCTNAYHAMRETGGVLEVKLGMIQVDKELSCLRVNLKEGKYVRLTVTDTGVGMNRATLERIFEPFFTTKAAGEGTGLGLSVVHGIIMAHGGDITVYSEPGKGTTFQVYLPCTENPCAEEEEEERPAAGRAERVLFVDDEPMNTQMGKQMLTNLGYDVTTRTSSLEALEAFRADPSRFDLVVTDQTMPQMTGVALTHELLALRPDLPVILITGFSETVTAQNYRKLGFAGYLMKPLIMREVAGALRQALDDAQSRAAR